MRGLFMSFVVALLAACGGSTDEPARDGSAEAADDDFMAEKTGCDLLSDSEAGQAIGVPITSHEEAGMNGCRWTGEDSVQLTLDFFTGSSLAPATCDAQKSLGTGREEEVPGLGDSALWKSGRSLVVCTPRSVIRFMVDNAKRTVPEDKEGVIAAARLVLDRL